MKIKLIEPGFESLTGDFGGVLFENGVSIEDVPPVIAENLSNLIRVEREDGSNPSTSQVVLESTTMVMSATMTRDILTGESYDGVTPGKVYTREELEVIADKGGIAALRAIGDPLGQKANAISKLIAMILEVQNPAAPVQVGDAAAAEQPAPAAE